MVEPRRAQMGLTRFCAANCPIRARAAQTPGSSWCSLYAVITNHLPLECPTSPSRETYLPYLPRQYYKKWYILRKKRMTNADPARNVLLS